MPDLKNFFHSDKLKKLKKSDWIVLALAGVLLLVVVLPADGKKEGAEGAQGLPQSEENISVSTSDAQKYAAALENKLEKILRKMDGVGNVNVMITVEDNGENIVEKDAGREVSTTMEEDGAGGVRSANESSQNTATVYVEEGGRKYPYVQKEIFPVIKGVIVVAEGGENSHVKTEITEAVQALFQVEAHRIKVLAMNRE